MTAPTAGELAAWRELAERHFPHISMPDTILRLLDHVAGLAAEVDRLHKVLTEAAGVIGDGFHRSGGTDVTSWDECVECGRPDWKGHAPACPMGGLITDIKKALKKSGS